jgi:hypothetical protein
MASSVLEEYQNKTFSFHSIKSLIMFFVCILYLNPLLDLRSNSTRTVLLHKLPLANKTAVILLLVLRVVCPHDVK